MIDVIDIEKHPLWIDEYRELLFETSQEQHLGWESLYLDEQLTSQERVDDFVFLLDKVCAFLKSKGSEIDVSELNDFEYSKATIYGSKSIALWQQPVDVNNLISVIIHIKNVALKIDGYTSDKSPKLSIT
jgi:hypothetical protein